MKRSVHRRISRVRELVAAFDGQQIELHDLRIEQREMCVLHLEAHGVSRHFRHGLRGHAHQSPSAHFRRSHEIRDQGVVITTCGLGCAPVVKRHFDKIFICDIVLQQEIEFEIL